MSRTRRGSKGPGYDYWSRRHPSNGIAGCGPFVKKRTHKWERRRAKDQLYEEEIEATRVLCESKSPHFIPLHGVSESTLC